MPFGMLGATDSENEFESTNVNSRELEGESERTSKYRIQSDNHSISSDDMASSGHQDTYEFDKTALLDEQTNSPPRSDSSELKEIDAFEDYKVDLAQANSALRTLISFYEQFDSYEIIETLKHIRDDMEAQFGV